MGVNRSRKKAAASAPTTAPAAATKRQEPPQQTQKTEQPPATAKRQPLKLKDDDSDDNDDDDEEIISELKVNQSFADAFVARKRKEELGRLERTYRHTTTATDGGDEDEEDSSTDESETEDEDGEQLTRTMDADISKTLQLIRNRDPSIYDQSITFFKDGQNDGPDEDDDESKKSGGHKMLYYKDLVRQQVLAGDVAASDDEDEEPEERVQTYGEEQAALRQAFLASLKRHEQEKEGANDGHEDDEEDDALDGGLFTLRPKTSEEANADDAEFADFEHAQKAKSVRKKDREMDPEAFLQYYVSSEAWKDKTSGAVPRYEDIVKDDDEDAEALDKADEFEQQYNFRFEEDGGGVIQTHARQIGDSMRREDDARKRKRAERKERKALERLKQEEELRRLKNLKQAEIQTKLDKVAMLMGTTTSDKVQGMASDLDSAFDPESYDKRMQEIFDESYYNEGDDDADMLEKPTWDDEEDKALFGDLPVEDEDDEEEQDDEEEEEAEEGEDAEGGDVEMENGEEEEDAELNEMKHMTPAEIKKAKEKYLDELYKLDYEDLIGDLRCRFKYRQVRTNDFGLTVDEIMAADDKELKQLVSLKRLAPYLDDEFNVDRKRLKQFKKSIREQRQEREAKRKKAAAVAETEASASKTDAPGSTGTEASVDAVAEPTSKKRKRGKKKSTSASAAVENESKSSKKKQTPLAEEEEQTVADVGGDEPKKKSRRSKKKTSEKNPYLATGLSSSRLESYKLAGSTSSQSKPKKK